METTPQVTDTAAYNAMIKARSALIMGAPFFGYLALHLALVEDTTIPTADVNGERIAYNPAFVNALSTAEKETLLAHEVLHIANLHHIRREARDAETWNEACDYAINAELVEAGFELPKGGLIDPQYYSKAAETIYAELDAKKKSGQGSGAQQPQQPQQPQNGAQQQPQSKPQQQQPQSKPQQQQPQQQPPQQPQAQPTPDPGGMGSVSDAPKPQENGAQPTPQAQPQPMSPADKRDERDKWNVRVMQAAQAAAGQGKCPASARRLIEKIKEPETDWKTILREFIEHTLPFDYTWSRPNRRFEDLILPSVYKEDFGEMVIVFDTSGSVDEKALAAFVGELNAIADDLQPERVHTMYCDSSVKGDVETFERGEEITYEIRGGGGTNFRPPFAKVEQMGIEPKCLIYFTDLACSRYPEPPDYPVLWACYTSRKDARFGEVINIAA